MTQRGLSLTRPTWTGCWRRWRSRTGGSPPAPPPAPCTAGAAPPAARRALAGGRGRGLVGPSGAGAGRHALADAVLGGIAAGDIGQDFPPSDPKWKGASSDRFLTHAVNLVKAKGGRMISADLTLICERPKTGPHRDALRTRLAELLGLPVDRVTVKPATTAGMGFTGRE